MEYKFSSSPFKCKIHLLLTSLSPCPLVTFYGHLLYIPVFEVLLIPTRYDTKTIDMLGNSLIIISSFNHSRGSRVLDFVDGQMPFVYN